MDDTNRTGLKGILPATWRKVYIWHNVFIKSIYILAISSLAMLR